MAMPGTAPSATSFAAIASICGSAASTFARSTGSADAAPGESASAKAPATMLGFIQSSPPPAGAGAQR